MDTAVRPATDSSLRLLNDWQHGFPLCRDPFGTLADATGRSRPAVLDALRQAQADGRISRIGGVFAHGSGGDAMLAAMAVPVDRIDAVAATVPGETVSASAVSLAEKRSTSRMIRMARWVAGRGSRAAAGAGSSAVRSRRGSSTTSRSAPSGAASAVAHAFSYSSGAMGAGNRYLVVPAWYFALFVAGVLLTVPLWLRLGGRAFWDENRGLPPHPAMTYANSRIPIVRRRR